MTGATVGVGRSHVLVCARRALRWPGPAAALLVGVASLAVPAAARTYAVAGVSRSGAGPFRFRTSGYRPQSVPADLLPGYRTYAISLHEKSRPTDANGIALYVEGSRRVYHPLVIARYGLDLLNGYRITKEQAYLDRAEANARFLIDHAVSRAGALYFPYRFKVDLFGDPSDVMRPPWYSALSQGTALSLFVRLEQITGDRHWGEAAAATFSSFPRVRSATLPWVSFVDRTGHLWLEEYPKNPPAQVLNGHIYALFGVYEYALATGSPLARQVFDGAVTTVKDEIDEFRVPGQISYYSLRRHVQYSSYHDVVIGQLQTLAAITGDRFFAHEAHLFTVDERKAEKPGATK